MLRFLFLFLSVSSMVAGAADAQRVASASDSIVFRPDVERKFVEAMHLFQAGRFDSSAAVFISNIREFPRSHRATGAYIMGGKALYLAGKYRDAVRLLKDLIDVYPFSSYVDDAHYTLGLVYYRLHRYDDAAEELLTAQQMTRDTKVAGRSERLLDDIAAEHLSTAELQVLVADATADELKALLNLRLAERIYRTGDVRAAEDILRMVTVMNPSIKYVGDALTLLDRIRKSGVVKVGVVLPLMLKSETPTAREVGMEFLNGIQIAADEYNAAASTKVNLDVRDTERDPARAAQQVAELCRDEKVAAILGPVLSNEVFASAGIANERGVPLITPTATSNGIAGIGPYVFQANPDFNVRGRATAVYAVKTLHAKRLAVVAPSDAIGKAMADAFVDEAAKRGSELVDVEWYAPGSTDIRSQLLTMRRKAFEKLEVTLLDFGARLKQSDLTKILRTGVSRRLLDSLLERGVAADVRMLFGERGREIADSLRLPVRTESVNVDSLALPVESIDAIFCPIVSSEEIAVVSTQLRFTNFRAQILGSGDWNDLNDLDENRQYTDGVMFMADAYFDPNGQAFREFKARYARTMKGRGPTVNTLFGYDVCMMLLRAIAGGSTHRNEIASALMGVRAYPGIHSRISFGPDRVNTYLSVLQYRARQIWKVGEIDLSIPEEGTSPTTP